MKNLISIRVTLFWFVSVCNIKMAIIFFMAFYKTVVSPLLKHWSYHSLMLSHWISCTAHSHYNVYFTHESLQFHSTGTFFENSITSESICEKRNLCKVQQNQNHSYNHDTKVHLFGDKHHNLSYPTSELSWLDTDLTWLHLFSNTFQINSFMSQLCDNLWMNWLHDCQ